MRKLALSLLLCGFAAAPHAALSQDAPPSVDDYVCAFSGECGDEDGRRRAKARPGTRPRVTATRGFALSGPANAARPRAATPPRRTTRRAGPPAQCRRRPPRRGGPPGPGQRVNLRLSFETGSAELTPAARAQAQVFAQSLLRPQLVNMRFRIEGHTDSVGQRARNVELSQRRAQAVADFLVNSGVGRERLVVRGYGPDRPLPGTRATAGENRRVEAVRIS